MSNLNNISNHGSTKLALFKFANAHSMDFLGMVLVFGFMIFDQVAKTIASILTYSGARFFPPTLQTNNYGILVQGMSLRF